MLYNYPLNISFKLVAIGPQISIKDSEDNEVLYAHMKAFKMKEAITVYKDSSESRALFTIKANKAIDFSAEYHITNDDGYRVGSMKQEGFKSILRASYNIIPKNGDQSHYIKEDGGILRALDNLFGRIPIIGKLADMVFHPAYTIFTMDDEPVIRIEKHTERLESKFTLDMLAAEIDQKAERFLMVCSLMLILLERERG